MSSRLALALLLVLALALLSGCPKPADQAVNTPVPEATPPSPETVEAPAGSFAWTETPTLDQVPDAPISGMINGKPFTAQTVRLEKRDDQVVLRIMDQKPDTSTGMVTGETSASLYLVLEEGKPAEFVAGIKDEKKDPADAIYVYPQGGDKGPMTMNSDWGAALKLDEWTLGKDPADEDLLGTVKGKVAIVFADDPKSWVAGTFEGVYYK